MRTLNLTQGSPEWLAHRSTARNASDAPAMLDCSPYQSRTELLTARKTGVRPEVSPEQQRRFDDGHAIEAAQRPYAEQVIGDDLYPVVGEAEVEGLLLSASFDGLTMLEDVVYECKTLNDNLREALPLGGPSNSAGYDLPKHYRVQMEQQLMVCGGERVLFVAANRDGSDVRSCWYYPDPALRSEILAGWRQFDADLQAFVPQAPAEVVRAEPVESLPVPAVRIDGALAVVDNLDLFGAKLREFVSRIPKQPATDQEFADTDAACKALKKAEEALDQAEAGALAQITSVEQLQRTVGDLRKLARDTRLAAEKVVKARKEQLRIEAVQNGRHELADHLDRLDATLPHPYMPAVPENFAGVISGLKTMDSIRNAISTELARCKMAADQAHTSIVANLKHLQGHASDFKHLFPDTAQLVLKPLEVVQATVTNRIAEHQAAEQRRAEELAERERARIRAEEEARAREVARQEQAQREAEERRQREEAARLEAQQEALKQQKVHEQNVALAREIGRIAEEAGTDQAPTVIPMRWPTAAPVAPAAPTLKLGEINRRLADAGISTTRDGLAVLGFTAAGMDRAAVMFHEADFPSMCRAMAAQLEDLAEQHDAVPA